MSILLSSLGRTTGSGGLDWSNQFHAVEVLTGVSTPAANTDIQLAYSDEILGTGGDFVVGTGGKITYSGTTKRFYIQVEPHMSGADGDNVWVNTLRTGATVTRLASLQQSNANGVENRSCAGFIDLENGDEIYCYYRSNSSTTDSTDLITNSDASPDFKWRSQIWITPVL